MKIYIVLQHNLETGTTVISECFTTEEKAEAWANFMSDEDDNYIFYWISKELHDENTEFINILNHVSD